MANNKEIGKAIKDRLARNPGYEPGPEVWENIIAAKRKKRRPIIFFWLGGLALLFIGITLGYLGYALIENDSDKVPDSNYNVVGTEDYSAPQDSETYETNSDHPQKDQVTEHSNNGTNKASAQPKQSRDSYRSKNERTTQYSEVYQRVKNEAVAGSQNPKNLTKHPSSVAHRGKSSREAGERVEPESSNLALSKQVETLAAKEETVEELLAQNNDSLSRAKELEEKLNKELKKTKSDSLSKTKKEQVWSVTVFAGLSSFVPLKSGNIFKDQGSSQNVSQPFQYGYGATLNYKVKNSKWQLRFGAQKLNVTQKWNNIPASQLTQGNLNRIGFGITDSEFDTLRSSGYDTLTLEYDLIQIPLELRYDLLKSKIGLQAIGTITGNLSDHKVIFSSDSTEREVGSLPDSVDFYLGMGAGLGANYPLIKSKLLINADAVYSANLFDNTNDDIDNSLINFRLGLEYKF
ncbi:hypothetical protein BST97_06620 [Nonlabens spongiae]|uniref:Outer membrane protein beta-barrel domain-containing protein n=1 Tax=Nonlabens spongiae TaxID=331648 RepID=A0A1W6MJL4_9FLAO|nr:hypothetical protein [Nonlabens spongiae]ARN77696.1 hypothetical protein BST97_06620 [Nonlabens spongiae]